MKLVLPLALFITVAMPASANQTQVVIEDGKIAPVNVHEPIKPGLCENDKKC